KTWREWLLAPQLSANRSKRSFKTEAGKVRVPRCSTRGNGPRADESQGCRLGCCPRTNRTVAGVNSIGIHGDRRSQRYCSTAINVGAVSQRDAVLRDNTSIKVSACPQGRRTANLPVNLVVQPRVDYDHRRVACGGERAPNLDHDHRIALALEIKG